MFPHYLHMQLRLKNSSLHSHTEVNVKCILNLKEKAYFLKKKVLSPYKRIHSDVGLRLLEQPRDLGPDSDLLVKTNSRLILEIVSVSNLSNTESATTTTVGSCSAQAGRAHSSSSTTASHFKQLPTPVFTPENVKMWTSSLNSEDCRRKEPMLPRVTQPLSGPSQHPE